MLGLLDITGIPYIVEGIVGQRAYGSKMNDFESYERIGMGVVFLLALLAIISLHRTSQGPIGHPLPGRTYGHTAMQVTPARLASRRARFMPD